MVLEIRSQMCSGLYRHPTSGSVRLCSLLGFSTSLFLRYPTVHIDQVPTFVPLFATKSTLMGFDCNLCYTFGLIISI